MAVYWQDFAILGSFLFLLALIWTFQVSFQKFSYLMTTNQSSSNDVPHQNCFQTKWLEGIMACLCAAVVLICYFSNTYNKDNFESSEEENRSFVVVMWLPMFMYGAVAISSEALSPTYKALVKPFLIAAFLCEFSIVTTHIQSMAPGTDKTMYTPIYLLIYFSSLVVLAELVIPDMEDLLVLRCGTTLMRGTWYTQVGFTLCMTGREWLVEESVGITVLFVFLWHIILSWIVIRVMQNTIKAVLMDQPWVDEDYEDLRDDSSSKGKRRLVGQKEPVQLTREQLLATPWSSGYLKLAD
ncbi:Transmembrane protein 45B [Holothuria leucospilota]|uniref:Transmembrane protein 45B n=1 Tax=Holothuria leucospilota TaxID=206669 RepID=A0A9Q1C8L3_HOLLE|nr:Transmembrane protein 45B [Holothuria leucospilota]